MITKRNQTVFRKLFLKLSRANNYWKVKVPSLVRNIWRKLASITVTYNFASEKLKLGEAITPITSKHTAELQEHRQKLLPLQTQPTIRLSYSQVHVTHIPLKTTKKCETDTEVIAMCKEISHTIFNIFCAICVTPACTISSASIAVALRTSIIKPFYPRPNFCLIVLI